MKQEQYFIVKGTFPQEQKLNDGTVYSLRKCIQDDARTEMTYGKWAVVRISKPEHIRIIKSMRYNGGKPRRVK